MLKKRKKQNIAEESYWKSATDIMAGVLLIIMLVMMLLMLYVMQMQTEDNKYNHESDYYDMYDGEDDDDDGTYEATEFHSYDEQYPEPHEGSGGGGADDPGTDEPKDTYPDEGHDKTAVFVTVVDEETGNAIKKAGTLFELYADKNATGGLQTLHTYYPIKTEYKQYETTDEGTFYLPEKITKGWYSMHNLVAPEGYGLAEDYAFEIDESLDWPEPFMVEIPLSPSKNRIYVRNVDSVSKDRVGGETYEVYAANDIVTLDGTVRFKSGELVDTFECDEAGLGNSKKLYLGNYYLRQKKAARYYAVYENKIETEIKLTDTDKDAIVVECDKTAEVITLTDEYSGDPIAGAVYSVTDRDDVTTDSSGQILLTDLDKETAYTLTPVSVPEPYKISAEPLTFKVDENGYISGEPVHAVAQTAYMVRITIDVKDIIFKNSVAGSGLMLYNSSGEIVEEWDSVGEPYLLEGVEPGVYTLDINNGASSIQVNVKDVATLQKAETEMWTMWDTILVAASVIGIALIVFIIIRLIRRGKRKKANEKQQSNPE